MTSSAGQPQLSAALKERARQEGFDPVGIACLPGSSRLQMRTAALQRWLDAGFQAEMGEETLQRIPLAGSVYKTLKQLLATFLRDNSQRFRRVVLVEYPREGLYSVGFVTGVVGPSLQAELTEPLLSVFIPTAPNPTTGWYTLVPETSVKDLDISVEDAFRTIISAGIVNPDEREAPVNRSFSSLISQLRGSGSPSSSTTGA